MSYYYPRLAAAVLLSVLISTIANAKPATIMPNDIFDERISAYAFINATIQTSPDQQLSNATLLIKDGKVIKVGSSLKSNLQ